MPNDIHAAYGPGDGICGRRLTESLEGARALLARAVETSKRANSQVAHAEQTIEQLHLLLRATGPGVTARARQSRKRGTP